MRLSRRLVVAGAVLAAALSAALAPKQADGPAQTAHAVGQPDEPRGTQPAVRSRPKPPPTFGRRVLERWRGGRVRYANGRILVKFEPGAGPSDVARALRRADGEAGGTVRGLGVRVVSVDPDEAAEALAELEASPDVAYAEREVLVRASAIQPNDVLWGSQWGLRLIRAEEAWGRATGSPRVVVAVVDTGVAFGHPDLQGSFVPGYDFANGDADPTDDEGHGTAVAGVIAARADNGEGGAGVCWTCSIMPLKVLDANGWGTTQAVASAIVWATDHGARVINLSLGAPATTQTLTDAVEYAVSKGVIVVAAAGNAGTATPSYPAAHPSVLGVAATTTADLLFEWSNRGSWVRLAAPGCNVAPARGGSYVEFCGTSSAAPIVAGLAGLALALRPQATRAEIEAVVEQTARRVADVRFGRVDADAALLRLVPTTTSATVKATFRSRFSDAARTRRFARAVGRGRLTARVTSASRPPIAVRVVDARGRVVARAAGRAPFRISKVVPAGRYRFVVSTQRARGPFRVVLVHGRP